MTKKALHSQLYLNISVNCYIAIYLSKPVDVKNSEFSREMYI